MVFNTADSHILTEGVSIWDSPPRPQIDAPSQNPIDTVIMGRVSKLVSTQKIAPLVESGTNCPADALNHCLRATLSPQVSIET